MQEKHRANHKITRMKKENREMHANQNLRVSLRPSKLSHLQES